MNDLSEFIFIFHLPPKESEFTNANSEMSMLEVK